MGTNELLVGGGLVAALVAMFVVSRLFGRGATSLHRSLLEQVEAARRAYPVPTTTLAEADLALGVPVTLRSQVPRREDQLSLWLEYMVDPGNGTAIWKGQGSLRGSVGAQRIELPSFTVGYDGEDHQVPPGLTGLTHLPDGSPPGVDGGKLRLATFPPAEGGAPVEVTVTLAVGTAYTSARFRVVLGAATPG